MKIKKVKWNEVTWYSKLLAVVVFALTFYVGFILGVQKEKINTGALLSNTQIANNIAKKYVPGDGKYCFARNQVATSTEPYSSKESVIFNIEGDVVVGNKKGNQSGPDMTNGYDGTLDGTIFDNTLYLFYSYTVEGSKNVEIEIYQLRENSLVKMRWPLEEKYGMLIPDKSGDPKMIYYSKVECSL